MKKLLAIVSTAAFVSACSTYNKEENSPITTLKLDDGSQVHAYDHHGDGLITYEVDSPTKDYYAQNPGKYADINRYNLPSKTIYAINEVKGLNAIYAKATSDNKIIISTEAIETPKNSVAAK